MAARYAPSKLVRDHARQHLGLVDLAVGHLLLAREHLAEADPDSPYTWWGLAWLDLEQGSFDAARAGFVRVSSAAQERCEIGLYDTAQLGIASIEVAAERYDDAERVLAGISTTDFLRRALEASALRGRDWTAEAGVLLDEALAMPGGRHGSVLAQRAEVWWALGERERATAAIREAEALARAAGEVGTLAYVLVRRAGVDRATDRADDADQACGEVARYIASNGIGPEASLARALGTLGRTA